MGLRELEIYDKKVHSCTFGEQVYAYHRSVDILKAHNPSFLATNSPAVIVMGGCHSALSALEFKDMCLHIHPYPKDKHIVLDINPSAVARIPHIVSTFKVTGNLEKIPLSDCSADALFLDFTLNFMNEVQLGRFGDEAARVLKPEGIVFAAIKVASFSITERWKTFWETRRHHTYFAPRSGEHFKELIPSLKPVLELMDKRFSLLALSRPDNSLPASSETWDFNIKEVDPHYLWPKQYTDPTAA